MSQAEEIAAKAADEEVEGYIESQAYVFQRNGSVYYVINRRDGVATPIGSEDQGGRRVALKAGKDFVEKWLAEQADIKVREAEYLARVKR
jgi:hypothetical protein